MLTSNSNSRGADRPETREVIELLQNPDSYAYHPDRVTTVETHISWVFLTDHFAYKLKKPVCYDFLDFSSQQKREVACAEELRLNRRMTHNVYIGLLPITYDQQHGLEIDGAGSEIDYVVKMRRLPEERSLKHMICQGRLPSRQIQELSALLVGFYQQAPPKLLTPEEFYVRLVEHCQSNQADLLRQCLHEQADQVRRIHCNQKKYLVLQRDLFLNRVRDGRIVDGHGDLRAEHAFLESPPQIIDCVEFSNDLREVDALDDLSFLAVDCQRLGNAAVGQRILADYAQATKDETPAELIAFYKSYRAAVRAKVAGLRVAQTDGRDRQRFVREMRQYINWADHHAAMLGPPTLIAVGGPMGSGKTTLANALADELGADVLHTDEVRRKICGMSQGPARYGEGIYDAPTRRRVYRHLFAHAADALDEGRSVVLDGAFLTNDLRAATIELGRRHAAQPLFVQCECPRATALARIAGRTGGDSNVSEARPELYDRQIEESESPAANLPIVSVDATTAIGAEVQAVATALVRLGGVA